RGFELIERVLPCLGAEYASALAETLVPDSNAKLGAKILHHLEFGVNGHEIALGDLAARVDMRTAFTLLRLLTRIDTLAAREAVGRAAASPHPFVRIEALGHKEGASGP